MYDFSLLKASKDTDTSKWMWLFDQYSTGGGDSIDMQVLRMMEYSVNR